MTTSQPDRQPFPERAASAALATLLDVGAVGFATWWGSLAPLQRDDILDELVDAIRGQQDRPTTAANPDRTPPPGGSGISPPPSPAAEQRRTVALQAAAQWSAYETSETAADVVTTARTFEAYLRGDQDIALERMRRLLLDVLADPNGCHLAEGLRERIGWELDRSNSIAKADAENAGEDTTR